MTDITTREEAIARIQSIDPIADLSWEGSFGGDGVSTSRTREEAGLFYNDTRPESEMEER